MKTKYKDINGRTVELGDIVCYSVYGRNLRYGIVTNFSQASMVVHDYAMDFNDRTKKKINGWKSLIRGYEGQVLVLDDDFNDTTRHIRACALAQGYTPENNFNRKWRSKREKAEVLSHLLGWDSSLLRKE